MQRKTVNPTFNEKFHWDVSQEESGQEDAVILFTVKDYDFLSHNDFLGEAVVPFSKVVVLQQNFKFQSHLPFKY